MVKSIVPYLIISAGIVAIIALLIFILPALSTSVFSNQKECPTGSAICSTAALLPGAVSIMSVFIALVTITAIVFVIFYIRTH